MAESVYKVIELIGTSKDSWEKAATAAVNRAGKSLRDLRVAEVVQLDLQLDAKGKVEAYRAKLKVSFKFECSFLLAPLAGRGQCEPIGSRWSAATTFGIAESSPVTLFFSPRRAGRAGMKSRHGRRRSLNA